MNSQHKQPASRQGAIEINGYPKLLSRGSPGYNDAVNRFHSFSRIRSAILPLTAFILPICGVLAPLGAAPLLAVAAVGVILTNWRSIAEKLQAVGLLIGLLAMVGAWATLSGLWSIIPLHSVLEGLRFLAISAFGIALLCHALNTGSNARRTTQALIVGALVALALLTVERFGDEPILRWWIGANATQYEPLSHYDRGVTVLVLLMAAIAVGDIERWLRLVLILATVAAATFMASTAALLAFAAGLLAFGFAYLAPRTVAGAMIAGMIALGIAIPVATPSYQTVLSLRQDAHWIKLSGIHRLLIWRFVADRIAERPLLGWGMDASRAIPGGETDFNDLLPTLHYPSRAEALPLHPHNAILQWQLELGIPGLILGLAVVATVLYRVGWRANLSRYARAVALALVAGALVIGLLSFGIWQAWWQSLLWLASVLYAASNKTALQASPHEQQTEIGTPV